MITASFNENGDDARRRRSDRNGCNSIGSQKRRQRRLPTHTSLADLPFERIDASGSCQLAAA
jgi:hypothetical protein